MSAPSGNREFLFSAQYSIMSNAISHTWRVHTVNAAAGGRKYEGVADGGSSRV